MRLTSSYPVRRSPALDHLPDLLGGALPDGPGDHARLAEAAAPGAAPEDLDVEPVVHDLGHRHQLLLRVGPGGQIGDGPLLDPLRNVGVPGRHRDQAGPVVGHVVAGGHVHALEPGQVAKQPLAGPGRAPPGLPGLHGVGYFSDRFLAVADDEAVDEVGERLRVEGAVSAGHHQRVVGTAIRGPDRHSGQVHAVEEVGVDQLGGQVEGQQVELCRRAVAVDREQRQTPPAQLRLHVGPGGVGAFGPGVGALVDRARRGSAGPGSGRPIS